MITINDKNNQRGFSLLIVFLLISLFASLFRSFMIVSLNEQRSILAEKNGVQGYYSAEAALTLRSKELLDLIKSDDLLSGTPPTDTSTVEPCVGSNMGTGVFACKTVNLNNQTISTFITFSKRGGVNMGSADTEASDLYYNIDPTKPMGMAGTSDRRFVAVAISRSATETSNRLGETYKRPETKLEMSIYDQSIPLGNFTYFSTNDLILRSRYPAQTHFMINAVALKDLYLDSSFSSSGASSNSVRIDPGNDTTIRIPAYKTALSVGPGGMFGFNYYGKLYRGSLQATGENCSSGLNVLNTNFYSNCSGSGVDEITDLELSEDYPALKTYFRKLKKPYFVPTFDMAKRGAGNYYWDAATVRIVLRLTSANAVDTTYSPTGIEVRNRDDSVDTTKTAVLNSCYGKFTGNKAFATTNSFYNHREGGYIRMLEVDLKSYLLCLNATDYLKPNTDIHTEWLNGTRTYNGYPFNSLQSIDLMTEASKYRAGGADGIVHYFGIDGPDSETVNKYGVRFKNAKSSSRNYVSLMRYRPDGSGHGSSSGYTNTFATDQSLYIQGFFNSGFSSLMYNLEDFYNAKYPHNSPYVSMYSWWAASTKNSFTYASHSTSPTLQVIADNINILSADFNDATSHLGIGSRVANFTSDEYWNSYDRVAQNSTFGYPQFYAPIACGTFITNVKQKVDFSATTPAGGTPTVGLIPDYFRFHEDWRNINNVHLCGSFAVLGEPTKVSGPITSQSSLFSDRAVITNHADIMKQIMTSNVLTGTELPGFTMSHPMKIKYISKEIYVKRLQ